MTNDVAPPDGGGLRSRLDWWVALALCAAALAAYHHGRAVAYSGDDFEYAALMCEAVTGETSFHPAGLRLLDPATGAPQRFGTERRWPIKSRYPLETLSTAAWVTWDGGEPVEAIERLRALQGAVAVMLFFLALRRWGVSTTTSAAAAVCFAVSRSFWDYSTHVDYSTAAVAWVLVSRFWRDADTRHRGLLVPAATVGEHIAIHRAAGGAVYVFDIPGDAEVEPCWNRVLASAGPPVWPGFGVAVRPLALGEAPRAFARLCGDGS